MDRATAVASATRWATFQGFADGRLVGAGGVEGAGVARCSDRVGHSMEHGDRVGHSMEHGDRVGHSMGAGVARRSRTTETAP